MRGHGYTVAPLVGAWIEMLVLRGAVGQIVVAPLVGAWIEILVLPSNSNNLARRTPCGCVD